MTMGPWVGRPGWGWGRSARSGPFTEASWGDAEALTQMAVANGWVVADQLPVRGDGSQLVIAGGPLGPPQVGWQVAGPVIVGRAGYWPFVAVTANVLTRAAAYQPYALTALGLPGPLAAVHVYPERRRSQLTAVMPEVDLESGAFNDHFAVFSHDRRTAYGVLSPRTMQALLTASAGRPDLDELWTWHDQLCIARIDGHGPAVLDTHLRLLTACAGDLPTSLWDSAGPPAEPPLNR